jgi:hypothetical protein
VADSFLRCNEPSGSIKCGKFLRRTLLDGVSSLYTVIYRLSQVTVVASAENEMNFPIKHVFVYDISVNIFFIILGFSFLPIAAGNLY